MMGELEGLELKSSDACSIEKWEQYGGGESGKWV
jgi:hypothetical protein